MALIKCPQCESEKLNKDGNHNGFQRYRCMSCGKRFDGERYDGNHQYIVHFKTRLKKSVRNSINRDTYCIPTNKCDYKVKKNLRLVQEYFEKNNCYPSLVPKSYCNVPNNVFADLEHYTDEFVQKHYKDCMDNYDLNMRYFNSLNHNEFNKCLLKTIRKFKFKEIDDLKVVNGVEGLYVLVLDQYNQAYIGQSQDIKRRILQHWSSKKDFGHLLFGNVNTSVLSVDSFGALDTTRIFYKEVSWCKIHSLEEQVTKFLDNKYQLNRVSGGLNNESVPAMRNIMLTASTNKRML